MSGVDPILLVGAIFTGIAGIITASAGLLNVLRKMPRYTSRTMRLISLLERVRDWLQAEELWDTVPTNLRRDINVTIARVANQEDDEPVDPGSGGEESA